MTRACQVLSCCFEFARHLLADRIVTDGDNDSFMRNGCQLLRCPEYWQPQNEFTRPGRIAVDEAGGSETSVGAAGQQDVGDDATKGSSADDDDAARFESGVN